MVRDLKARLWDVERPSGTWAPATKGLTTKELNFLGDGFPGAPIPRDEAGVLWARSMEGPYYHTVGSGFGTALGYGPPATVIPDDEWYGTWDRDEPPYALTLPRDGYYGVSAGVILRAAPGETAIPYVHLFLYLVNESREVPYG
ncbi:hypothetical protein QUT57_22685, partial [Xanthomonas citri pv. citri]